MMEELKIKDRFNVELPADKNEANQARQVFDACFSYVTPTTPSNPKLIHASEETAKLLGLSVEDINSNSFVNIFSGKELLEGTRPYAMCYGGHQFGHWAGQLGDGRAINLTEVEYKNKIWALQLKGSGKTPYSRTADGLAVLRSSIREHLCSEAMFHLGVPTTRSLSLMLSGDQVLRDMMYDGNAAYEKGAIVCRVAPSFIRFGNFEIFASREDVKSLTELTDFTIRHFHPKIKSEGKQKYIDLFQTVAQKTMEMIVHWQRVGFVHGVMNTDNLSILGLTIDYGPYGWLEGYDHHWTPNTTDRQNRRYRYGFQPRVALWNLVRLANALYPLVEETDPFEGILDQVQTWFFQAYLNMMHDKLGLAKISSENRAVIQSLEEVLQASETDMTIFFRRLADFTKDTDLRTGDNFLEAVRDAFYKPEEITGEILEDWRSWFDSYQKLLVVEDRSDSERAAAMNLTNPKYVLRNYMAQVAIDAADKGDHSIVHELYELLKQPYSQQPEMEKWFAKRPEWARNKVGCSMLSCSS